MPVQVTLYPDQITFMKGACKEAIKRYRETAEAWAKAHPDEEFCNDVYDVAIAALESGLAELTKAMPERKDPKS